MPYSTWDNLMFLKCMKTQRQDMLTYFDPFCILISYPGVLFPFLSHPLAVCPCFNVAVRPSSLPLQPEELTLLLIKLRRQQAELNSIREHTVAQLMQLDMDGDNPKVRPPRDISAGLYSTLWCVCHLYPSSLFISSQRFWLVFIHLFSSGISYVVIHFALNMQKIKNKCLKATFAKSFFCLLYLVFQVFTFDIFERGEWLIYLFCSPKKVQTDVWLKWKLTFFSSLKRLKPLTYYLNSSSFCSK